MLENPHLLWPPLQSVIGPHHLLSFLVVQHRKCAGLRGVLSPISLKDMAFLLSSAYKAWTILKLQVGFVELDWVLSPNVLMVPVPPILDLLLDCRNCPRSRLIGLWLERLC